MNILSLLKNKLDFNTLKDILSIGFVGLSTYYIYTNTDLKNFILNDNQNESQNRVANIYNNLYIPDDYPFTTHIQSDYNLEKEIIQMIRSKFEQNLNEDKFVITHGNTVNGIPKITELYLKFVNEIMLELGYYHEKNNYPFEMYLELMSESDIKNQGITRYKIPKDKLDIFYSYIKESLKYSDLYYNRVKNLI